MHVLNGFWIKPSKTVKVLDYDCGAGEIVNELRSHDINAYGCDVFYEGEIHLK